MHRVLLIVTQNADGLTQEILAQEQAQPDRAMEIFDLTVAEPDYAALLEKVFAADAVQVW
jgi:hypothetical protein